MKFYAELLIFVLLFLTNARILFTKRARRDSLVNLAPLSFILSILIIFAWNIDVFTILCLLLSLIVLLSNFHALLRFSSHLYIDHYSNLMKIWAHFTNILSLAALVFTIFFAPVETLPGKSGATNKLYKYDGSFKTGFYSAETFSKTTCYFHEFKKTEDIKNPEVKTEKDNIIIFFPDKRGDTIAYEPFLNLLAAEGYTVYSADFYSSDCKWLHSVCDAKILRRFAMVCGSYFNNQTFMSQREFYTYNSTQEINAVLNILKDDFNLSEKVFLVSDVMANTAIEDYFNSNSEKVAGIFNFDSILSYETKGYGCIEQTDPLLAYALGFKKDRKNINPKIMAQITAKEAEKVFEKPEINSENTESLENEEKIDTSSAK